MEWKFTFFICILIHLKVWKLHHSQGREGERGRERDRCGWRSHPQVVFVAESLQQLLVVSVTHLSQQCQQTSHKLSLA